MFFIITNHFFVNVIEHLKSMFILIVPLAILLFLFIDSKILFKLAKIIVDIGVVCHPDGVFLISKYVDRLEYGLFA